MTNLPKAETRVLETDYGKAVGASFAWDGGQYCAIHTSRGVVGCGIYDIACANEFGMAFASPKGRLNIRCEPEDLYEARIVLVSLPAEELGIRVGMTGREALEILVSED